jgi:hypothetical protein
MGISLTLVVFVSTVADVRETAMAGTFVVTYASMPTGKDI